MNAQAVIAEALHLAPGDIPADGTFDSVEGWDSLGHVRIVGVLERELGRPLEAEEVMSIFSVAEIDALLASGG